MGFSKKAATVSKHVPEQPEQEVEGFEEKPFVRDNSDNKLFTDIQVKDISGLITDDCTGVFDFDTTVFQACSNVETKYIRVTNEETRYSEEFPNITTFWGRGKKIGESSALGLLNVDRELDGREPFTKEDFVVENLQKMKYDTEEKTIDQAKIQIYKAIKKVKEQFGIDNVRPVIGEGDNFRHKLDLCRPYKGERSPMRPLVLKKVRKWVVEELKAIVATPRKDGEMVEADDVVEYYGAKGYQHYRKHGKFNYLVIASDKDAQGNPKLLVNPDTHSGEHNPLKGKFKFPQAMLIEATDVTCGDLELVAKKSTSEVKGYGFKFIMYQALLGGDGADNYNALSHLGKDLKFGDQAAYKALKPCKSAKECLQSAIDVFAEKLPYGVQYTTHDGRDLDVDCLTYMDTYFKVAYMLRSEKDTMDLYKLCEVFKVDISAVVGNNKFSAPVRTYIGNQQVSEVIEGHIKEIVEVDLKAFKSKSKGDLVELLERVKGKLELVDFEPMYEMQQQEK
ncbi:PIN domain-like protein [Vibrio phage 1.121.O._10N.286.46.C4]|nr:PIN domain-like protein [Vibrio phage 1.121.O._10N.286.46.C4]